LDTELIKIVVKNDSINFDECEPIACPNFWV